jgi:hypothetical protein
MGEMMDCLELIDVARQGAEGLSLPNWLVPLRVYDRIVVGEFFWCLTFQNE